METSSHDNNSNIVSTQLETLILASIQTLKLKEEVSKKLFKWFDDNLMKSNADKCHLLVSTNETVKIKVGNYDITVNVKNC